MLGRNKQGGLLDFMEWIPALFVFGIVALFFLTFMSSFNNNIQGMNNSTVPSSVKSDLNSFDDGVNTKLDVSMLFLLLGFFGVSMYSAYMKSVDSIFGIVVVILLFLLPFAGFMIEDFWDDVSSTSSFSTASGRLPITNFVLNHLGMVLLIYSFLTGSLLFIKGDSF